MTLPFETCSTELEWWWWIIISVIIIALIGAVGFLVYKLINRRKQNKAKSDKKDVKLEEVQPNEMNNTDVIVDQSAFDNSK